jgi:hypothetical protein
MIQWAARQARPQSRGTSAAGPRAAVSDPSPTTPTSDALVPVPPAGALDGAAAARPLLAAFLAGRSPQTVRVAGLAGVQADSPGRAVPG